MNRTQQSGAVMIAALVISALVVSLSIGLAVSHDRSLLRAESRFHGNQAREYVFGGEDLARFVLDQDLDDDQQNNEVVDSYNEGWSEPQQFPLDEGALIGQIYDAQARFDINRLVVAPTGQNNSQNGGQNGGQGSNNPQGNNNPQNLSPTDPMRYTSDQRQFIRLLQLIDEENPMSLSDAVDILEAVIDWLDEDSTPFGFGGAESLYYQRADPPITPTNGPIISITELRYVKGITPEIYQALAPHIIALPAGNGMNVNTASKTLIKSLNVDSSLLPLSDEDADQIILDRAGEYLDHQEFLGGQIPASLSSQGNFDTDNLTVDSQYFILSTHVEVGRQRRSIHSLLFRDGSTSVVYHSDFASDLESSLDL